MPSKRKVGVATCAGCKQNRGTRQQPNDPPQPVVTQPMVSSPQSNGTNPPPPQPVGLQPVQSQPVVSQPIHFAAKLSICYLESTHRNAQWPYFCQINK